MELAQQGVYSVSGTGTTFKTDKLKFSATKQHNKSNQHRNHNVSNNNPTKPGFRCAYTVHTTYECKHKTNTCAYCKKFGHLQSNCFAKNVNLSYDNEKVAYTLYVSGRSAPYRTNIMIYGKPVSMEIDIGAAVTIMSKDVCYDHYHCSKVPMVKQSEEMLSTYTGEKIPILSTYAFPQKGNQLPLTIVSGSGPTLLDRNWLNSINMDWSMIHIIATTKYTHLLKTYSQVFSLTNTKPVK